MKTLILHHVEPIWAHSLKTLCGVYYEDYQKKIVRHLQQENYDLVVLHRFEQDHISKEELSPDHPLYLYLDSEAYLTKGSKVKIFNYGYGWLKREAKHFEKAGDRWCKGLNNSEIVWIPKWMEDYVRKSKTIKIAGIFDGACIEDLQLALDDLDVNYERINHLIF